MSGKRLVNIIAPEQVEYVRLQVREGRSFTRLATSHRPIGPAAIFGVAARQPGITLFGPQRIFEDDSKSDRQDEQWPRPRYRAKQRRADDQ